MRLASSFRLLLCVPLVGSAACGGHLYRESEHGLALRADTALHAAKLRESLVGERAVIDSLLERELAAVRRQALATRDAEMRSIIGGSTADTSWNRLGRRASARLSDLVGDSITSADMVQALSNVTQFETGLESEADLYRINNAPDDPAPSCPIGARPNAEASDKARTQFGLYEENCNRYLAAQQALGSFAVPRTKLGATNALIGQTEAFVAALRDSVGKIRKAYKAAKEKHTAAVEGANQSAARDAVESAKKLLEQLDRPIEVGKALDSQFEALKLEGAIAKVEEQRQTIAEVLDGVLGSNADDAAKPPPNVQTAIRLLALLPALETRVSALEYPGVSVLLLESERLRLRSDDLNHRLTSARTRIELLKEQRALMIQETAWLSQAQSGVRAVREDTTCAMGNRPLAEALPKTTSRCRERVARSLLSYANSWTLARVPQEEIYYQLIGLRHAAVLDASENSLAQWESLIGVPVNRIIAYYGSGIRSADIATMVNALGLGAIAIAAAP